MKKKRTNRSVQNARFMKSTFSSNSKSKNIVSQQENVPPNPKAKPIQNKTINKDETKFVSKKNYNNYTSTLSASLLQQVLNNKNYNHNGSDTSSRLSAKNHEQLENEKNEFHNYQDSVLNILVPIDGYEKSNEHSEINSDNRSLSNQKNSENEVPVTSLQIKEAQETCKHLRQQIDTLKNKQKLFIEKSLIVQKQNDNSPVKVAAESIFKSASSISLQLSDTNTSLSDTGTNTSTDVSFKCLDIKALNNTMIQPNKIIKRLYLQKEKYKKKVYQLQTAMEKLKADSAKSAYRSPDIPSHHVVYYNADLIGEGRMSLVYSGTIYQDKKTAVKKLIRPDMISPSDRSYLLAEAGLLMNLHHHNIVEVFGVSTSPLQPLLLTELIVGITLYDKIHNNEKDITSSEYFMIARDTSVGMAFLHSQKPPVLHLNLRPCNVFINANGKSKVADFGFSKLRSDTAASNRVNMPYMAPELLHFPVHLTTKLDVFSYAVMLWEMSTGEIPHNNISLSEILEYIKDGKRLTIPKGLPSAFHNLISLCWSQSPLQRPSFKEIIIVIETMILPNEWTDEIRKSGIERCGNNNLPKAQGSLLQSLTKPLVCPISASKHLEVDSKYIERQQVADRITLESDMIAMGYSIPPSARFISKSKRPNQHSKAYQDIENKLKIQRERFPYRFSPPNVPPRMPPSNMTIDEISQHYNMQNPLAFSQSKLDIPTQNVIENKVISNGKITPHSAYQKAEAVSGPIQLNSHNKYSSFKPISPFNPDEKSISSEFENQVSPLPLPLTDRDLRYFKQDFDLETPKIIYQARPGNQTASEISRSEDYIKAVDSLPQMRKQQDLNSKTEFDSKFHTYLSDACERESWSAADVQDKGWKSLKSNILHRQPTNTLSDGINVLSIATSEADHCFKTKQESDGKTITSAGSFLTTVYRPTQRQKDMLKKQIKQSHLNEFGSELNTTISITLEGNSSDENKVMLKSTGNTSIDTNTLQDTSDSDNGKRNGFSRSSSQRSTTIQINCSLESQTYDRAQKPKNGGNGSFTQKKLYSNRGSKLERSYTPDKSPLVHIDKRNGHRLTKGQLSYSWNPVPTAISDSDSRIRRSFSNGEIAACSSDSDYRYDEDNRTNKYKEGSTIKKKQGHIKKKSRSVHVKSKSQPAPVISSSQDDSEDSVNKELKQTADDLSNISNILLSAAKNKTKIERS